MKHMTVPNEGALRELFAALFAAAAVANHDYGLTKRELFAALFAAAAIANPDITAPVGTIVSDSITVADRMINALNEQDDDEEDAS